VTSPGRQARPPKVWPECWPIEQIVRDSGRFGTIRDSALAVRRWGGRAEGIRRTKSSRRAPRAWADGGGGKLGQAEVDSIEKSPPPSVPQLPGRRDIEWRGGAGRTISGFTYACLRDLLRNAARLSTGAKTTKAKPETAR
jgi:hypothetical protein